MTLQRLLVIVVFLACFGLIVTDQFWQMVFGLIWFFVGFCVGVEL
jgi:hypothetical protein